MSNATNTITAKTRPAITASEGEGNEGDEYKGWKIKKKNRILHMNKWRKKRVRFST